MSEFDKHWDKHCISSNCEEREARGHFEAGAQSKQAEIDELRKRIDEAVHILTYTNHASTPLCNELRDILKGTTNEQ